MKILYAIQATGNGHVSRANEILPYLTKRGDVDVFLSGSNSQLSLKTHEVKYRSKGLSLFCNKKGQLEYLKTAKQINPFRIYNEAKQLPVEQYDMVINDYESITSLACMLKKVPSVSLSHQAAFQSPNTPRANKQNWFAERILLNYARANNYIGFHFKEYDDFIFKPIIKESILCAKPTNKGHITVYLLCYGVEYLIKKFNVHKNITFHVFTPHVQHKMEYGNVALMPLNNDAFNESMISCAGVITGGGFETPAEVLHLNKKLMAIPIKGQYEQECNAAALQQIGVTVIKNINNDFTGIFNQWFEEEKKYNVQYQNIIPQVLDHLFASYPYQEQAPQYQEMLASYL